MKFIVLNVVFSIFNLKCIIILKKSVNKMSHKIKMVKTRCLLKKCIFRVKLCFYRFFECLSVKICFLRETVDENVIEKPYNEFNFIAQRWAAG